MQRHSRWKDVLRIYAGHVRRCRLKAVESITARNLCEKERLLDQLDVLAVHFHELSTPRESVSQIEDREDRFTVPKRRRVSSRAARDATSEPAYLRCRSRALTFHYPSRYRTFSLMRDRARLMNSKVFHRPASPRE